LINKIIVNDDLYGNWKKIDCIYLYDK
jgi:hypothetical protein